MIFKGSKSNTSFSISFIKYSDKDSIIVLFSNEKDPDLGIQETEVEVNEDDAYYQSLLSRVSLENIVEMTAEYKRLGSLEYNTNINNKAPISFKELTVAQNHKRIERFFNDGDIHLN